jgi:hypothetical protein
VTKAWGGKDEREPPCGACRAEAGGGHRRCLTRDPLPALPAAPYEGGDHAGGDQVPEVRVLAEAGSLGSAGAAANLIWLLLS